MYLDEDCNGQANEQGSFPRKPNDKIFKELSGMKIGCKDAKLKAKQVLAKEKTEIVEGLKNQQRRLHWLKQSLMNMVVIDGNINDKGQMTSGKIDGMRNIDHMF